MNTQTKLVRQTTPKKFTHISYLAMALLVSLSLLFSGCVLQSPVEESEASAVSAQKPLIVATFNPLGDVAYVVAGDVASVELLVPMGSEPHDFDPSPQDIRVLSRADIVLANGAGLDSWVDELIVASGNKNVTLLRLESNVTLLVHDEHTEETGTAIELAGNEPLSEEYVGEEHPEDVHTLDDGHDHHDDETDPHIWLSPKNLIALTAQVAQELSRVDPANAAQYTMNAQTHIARLTALDSEITTTFSSCADTEFIILHGFLGYFCAAYGCEQIGVQGISPESDLTPKQLALAIDVAKEHQIKAVVSEVGASDKTEQAIADAIGGTVIAISAFERKAADDPRGYIETMQSNLQAFKSALRCSNYE